jgi:NhaP-type Na+/H+ or K+/H+ antiporter
MKTPDANDLENQYTVKTVLRTLLNIAIFLVLYAVCVLALAPIAMGFVHDHQPPSVTVRILVYVAALIIAIQAMRRVMRWIYDSSFPPKS